MDPAVPGPRRPATDPAPPASAPAAPDTALPAPDGTPPAAGPVHGRPAAPIGNGTAPDSGVPGVDPAAPVPVPPLPAEPAPGASDPVPVPPLPTLAEPAPAVSVPAEPAPAASDPVPAPPLPGDPAPAASDPDPDPVPPPPGDAAAPGTGAPDTGAVGPVVVPAVPHPAAPLPDDPAAPLPGNPGAALEDDAAAGLPGDAAAEVPAANPAKPADSGRATPAEPATPAAARVQPAWRRGGASSDSRSRSGQHVRGQRFPRCPDPAGRRRRRRPGYRRPTGATPCRHARTAARARRPWSKSLARRHRPARTGCVPHRSGLRVRVTGIRATVPPERPRGALPTLHRARRRGLLCLGLAHSYTSTTPFALTPVLLLTSRAVSASTEHGPSGCLGTPVTSHPGDHPWTRPSAAGFPASQSPTR